MLDYVQWNDYQQYCTVTFLRWSHEEITNDRNHEPKRHLLCKIINTIFKQQIFHPESTSSILRGNVCLRKSPKRAAVDSSHYDANSQLEESLELKRRRR